MLMEIQAPEKEVFSMVPLSFLRTGSLFSIGKDLFQGIYDFRLGRVQDLIDEYSKGKVVHGFRMFKGGLWSTIIVPFHQILHDLQNAYTDSDADDSSKLIDEAKSGHNFIKVEETEIERKLLDLLPCLKYDKVLIYVDDLIELVSCRSTLINVMFHPFAYILPCEKERLIGRKKLFEGEKLVVVTTDLYDTQFDIVINYDGPSSANSNPLRVGRAAAITLVLLLLNFKF